MKMEVVLSFLACAGAAVETRTPQEHGGPPRAETRIAAEALREDVDVLQRLYETAHPGLYRYNTREQMDQHFATLRTEFAEDRTLGEAYVAFSRFLSKLQCGHSYANFFNQPKEVKAELFEEKNRVPFTFRWMDGKMIVTGDLTGTGELPAGTEVVTIDGKGVRELLDTMMGIARADGGNDAKRRAYLEVRGNSRFEPFDIFLPLFHPAVGERLRLEVRRFGEDGMRVLEVEAHDLAQRTALSERAEKEAGAAEGDLWTFRTLDDGTAYLRMPGWALYNSDWDWRGFLNRGMDELVERKAPALILDIRGNEGGLDVGDVLLERMIERPLAMTGMGRYTRYRKLPADLEKYVTTWDASFKDWGDEAVDAGSGFYRLRTEEGVGSGGTIRPRGRRFEGDVVVLIGAENSSATFQFAERIKLAGRGTLIGQATGGNQRGINGGAFFFATLPNSRIEVDLPLISTFPVGAELPDGTRIPFGNIPDAGIAPDLEVVPRVEDVAREVDAELEAARKYLKEAR